ncbi:40S ribosomal protein S15 isoform X1 [Nycticebus coucang]|uniref:40S ribosomal protein S15 isoform X1 n=1 Tax=Nycticebus coucang TaxID=9470 RepID=UPI00234E0E2A|nr:40S ribosomal protein S15 isoform X1 [Nycticebus coucang]
MPWGSGPRLVVAAAAFGSQGCGMGTQGGPASCGRRKAGKAGRVPELRSCAGLLGGSRGRSGAKEEADLPQVHLPWRGSRPVAGYVLRFIPIMGKEASVAMEGVSGHPHCLCCPPSEQLMQLYSARQRRRLNRGLRRKQHSLLKRLRKAKKEAPPMEKPEVVKTHLRDMIILPEMVGSMVGVYNGKTFNQVEIKPEMIGHYLGEFSITYKPVKHGRPGIGATHSSRFIPLK